MQIKGIHLELSMVKGHCYFHHNCLWQVTFLYGCLLREQIHSAVSDMLTVQGDRSAAALESIKALRSVAGVFKHIHTTLSESISTEIESQTNLSVIRLFYSASDPFCATDLQNWCQQ